MAKLLAVEDEPLVRILIVDALESAGHTVIEAADGDAALQIVMKTPDIDLVVTDVRIPRMDGFSLALAARRLRPDLKTVFITGYSGAAVPAELAPSTIMQKPFDPDDLVVMVAKLLAANGDHPN